MYDRKAFKREARELMRASTPHYMLVALVYVLLTTGLGYVVTAVTVTGAGGALVGTLGVFLSILVGLFSMVMAIGLAYYALRLSRREQTSMGNLFEGFAFAGRSIGMNLLVALYTFLWSLLFMVAFSIVGALAFYLLDSLFALGIVLMIVNYVALVAAIIWVVLRYAMASFALAENPDDGVSAAIRRSVKMMRGNRWKLFVMELSFVGWGLLIALIALVVMVIGFVVSGTGWIVESTVMTSSMWEMYNMIDGLAGQMTIWTALSEIVCLPLTLWLTVYMQTSFARFYNFVSGYTRSVNGGGQAEERPTQVIPPAETVSDTPAPPAGGYYTPAPRLDDPETDEAGEDTAEEN